MKIARLASFLLMIFIVVPVTTWSGDKGFQPPVVIPTSDSTHSSSVPTAVKAVSKILLDMSPEQVVNHPFINTAQILLQDEYGQPVLSYDLSVDPILLSCDVGMLVPSTLDDNSLFDESNGTVDLLAAGVYYIGPSGTVTITASNSTATSTGVVVWFSGYDILEASDTLGNAITTLYAGLLDTIRVTVRNGGTMTAISDPSITAYFASPSSGSVKRTFAPGANGVVDSLRIGLETRGLEVGSNTLILMLESEYLPGDTVRDSLKIPVDILTPPTFALMDGSLKPDSVYAGVPFDISFDINIGEFAGVIDSTLLTITLSSSSGPPLDTIFEGMASFVAIDDTTIGYRDLEAVIDSLIGLDPGWYQVELGYRLVSQWNVFGLASCPPDSIYVVESAVVEYNSGTLVPHSVGPGAVVPFSFDISLTGSEPVLVDHLSSSFQLSGEGFSHTVNVIVPGNTLVPGTNSLTTERVTIPAEQLGDNLTVSAVLVYRQLGVANTLVCNTDFEGQTIPVEPQPQLQILDVSIVSPNAPKVNTAQAFQVCCLMANQSTIDMTSFQLRLSSDGSSSFDSTVCIAGLPAEGTVEKYFDVVAAADTAIETFSADIIAAYVEILDPIDNTVQAIIQEPALLSVITELRGAGPDYVEAGESFEVDLTINNLGQAQASSGTVEISTHGIDLGATDTLFTELLEVGSTATISFTAPPFETDITIDFTLIDRPADLNTNQTALVHDTTSRISLMVAASDVALVTEMDMVTSGLVTPGEEKDLFLLRISNGGISSVIDITLDSLSISVVDRNGRPRLATSVLDVGSAGLFSHGTLVSDVVADSDRLILRFADSGYSVPAMDTVELVFRARVTVPSGTKFGFSLRAEDIAASFSSGPHTGQNVPIVTPEGEDEILQEMFTTVEATLCGSFTIRDNPFNPEQDLALFSYHLIEPSAVEFCILSLLGEIVHYSRYSEGETGAQAGENFVTWDGRNDLGDQVLSGVYIAVITSLKDSRQARLKVAVIK